MPEAALIFEPEIAPPSASRMAAETMAQLLTSPAFTKIWRRHYPSRAETAQHLAQDYKDHADDLAAKPELVSFAHKFISLERAALEDGKKEIADLQPGLLAMEWYFHGLKEKDAPGLSWEERLLTKLRALRNVPAKISEIATAMALAGQTRDMRILKDALGIKSMPKETHAEEFRRETMEKMLGALEDETAQASFSPVSSSWNFLKKWAMHFVEEIGEHKVVNGILFTFSIGLYKFMMLRLPSSTIRITPQETTINNLSLDSIMDDGQMLTYDPSQLKTSLPQSCHDHLKMLTGSETIANFARDKLTIGSHHLFPQDCTKMNTFALDAQNRLLASYNYWNSRMSWFIEDRVTDVSHVLPNSSFITAFNNAAHKTAQYVYLFDNIENITFHGALSVTAFGLAFRLTTMNHEEAREKWNGIKDFFKRTARNNYLNYGLAAAAAGAYAYSGFAPVSQAGVMEFWSGLAGCSVGHYCHKFMNAARRQTHTKEFMAPVKMNLQQFSSFGLQDSHAPALINTTSKKPSWIKTRLLAPLALAATLGAGSMVYTHPAQAAEIAGDAAGKAAVTGSYLFLNVPQDTMLHVIFALAGGFAGCALGIPTKYATQAYKRSRRKDEKPEKEKAAALEPEI